MRFFLLVFTLVFIPFFFFKIIIRSGESYFFFIRRGRGHSPSKNMKASSDWSTSSVSSSVILSEKGNGDYDISSFSLSPSMSVASCKQKRVKATFGKLAEEALARGKQAAQQQFEAAQSPEPDYYQASSLEEESEELTKDAKELIELISKTLSKQNQSSQQEFYTTYISTPAQPSQQTEPLSVTLTIALSEGTNDIHYVANQLFESEGATSVADVLQKFLPMLAHSFLREQWSSITSAWQTGAGPKNPHTATVFPKQSTSRVPMVPINVNAVGAVHSKRVVREAFPATPSVSQAVSIPRTEYCSATPEYLLPSQTVSSRKRNIDML